MINNTPKKYCEFNCPLQDKGFNNIFNISEGMVGNGSTTGWLNRNLPVIDCNEECK